MQAHEVMTRNVVTASPSAHVGELANLMVKNRISAIPIVVENNHLVGIVTESDLLHRHETHTERKRKWWVELLVDPDAKSRELIKSQAVKAEDLMTRLVVTVKEATPLAEVAYILDSHRIRRVAVVRDGALVGIVSRADLVRALAAATQAIATTTTDNGALHKAVYDAIQSQPWINTLYMSFTVNDGVVELTGYANSADQKKALRVLVESVPGVKEVIDRLQPRPLLTTA